MKQTARLPVGDLPLEFEVSHEGVRYSTPPPVHPVGLRDAAYAVVLAVCWWAWPTLWPWVLVGAVGAYTMPLLDWLVKVASHVEVVVCWRSITLVQRGRKVTIPVEAVETIQVEHGRRMPRVSWLRVVTSSDAGERVVHSVRLFPVRRDRVVALQRSCQLALAHAASTRGTALSHDDVAALRGLLHRASVADEG